MTEKVTKSFSFFINLTFFKNAHWTSLVIQWIRTHLPTQGTQVWSLVQKDPTCHRATRPVCHNYRARMLQLLKPTCQEPMLHNKRSRHSGKAHVPQLGSSPQSLQRKKAQHSHKQSTRKSHKKFKQGNQTNCKSKMGKDLTLYLSIWKDTQHC